MQGEQNRIAAFVVESRQHSRKFMAKIPESIVKLVIVVARDDSNLGNLQVRDFFCLSPRCLVAEVLSLIIALLRLALVPSVPSAFGKRRVLGSFYVARCNMGSVCKRPEMKTSPQVFKGIAELPNCPALYALYGGTGKRAYVDSRDHRQA